MNQFLYQSNSSKSRDCFALSKYRIYFVCFGEFTFMLLLVLFALPSTNEFKRLFIFKFAIDLITIFRIRYAVKPIFGFKVIESLLRLELHN